MHSYKEIWDLVTSILRWGTLVIGGGCVLAYSASIGQPPEDPSLGESIVLSLLSMGFLAAYALYWLGVTSVGLWILRWPMHLLRYVAAKVPLRALGALPADYKIMWSLPVWVLAALTIVITFRFFRLEVVELVQYLHIAGLQGFLGGLLLLIRRRAKFQNSGLNITRDKRDAHVDGGELRRDLLSY